MPKSTSFRVGKVRAYLRGSAWYLHYHDNGQRFRLRVAANRETARQLRRPGGGRHGGQRLFRP